MRINKYLSTLGIASRRAIDKLVEENKILVNGEVATHGTKVSSSDNIVIDGKKINNELNEKVYFILNKPLRVLSTVSDDRERKTVIDLIKCDQRIFPVGRLDYMTTGLLILTNDGDLYNRVIHPREEVYKQYEVKALGKLDKKDILNLQNGIMLDDGKTLPTIIEDVKIKEQITEFKISIREGRNKQIRRMMESINHKVLHLSRIKIGELELGSLKSGEYRKLTKKEIDYLYSL